MRRSEREITDRAQLVGILDSCKVLCLAMVDNGKPYVVPLNYGYSWDGELPTLYLHCAGEGRKLDILRRSPDVCFEMDCGHELIPAPTACAYGFRYSSIIGEGVAAEIKGREQKRSALDLLMACQTDGQTGFTYTDQMLDAITVLKIEVSSLSGKVCA